MSIVRNQIIDPTPFELAMEFANWDDDKQVEFLNYVAVADSVWGGPTWPFQLQSVMDNKDLTYEARAWMQLIGEYSGLYK